MDNRPLRPLLPARDRGVLAEANGQPLTMRQILPNVQLKRRQRATRVACNHCRNKKTACDAQRPCCGRCEDRSLTCIYTSQNEAETPTMALKRENKSLKESVAEFESLVSHLRDNTEDVAHDILQQLRAAVNTQSFISNMAVNQAGEEMTDSELLAWASTSPVLASSSDQSPRSTARPPLMLLSQQQQQLSSPVTDMPNESYMGPRFSGVDVNASNQQMQIMHDYSDSRPDLRFAASNWTGSALAPFNNEQGSNVGAASEAVGNHDLHTHCTERFHDDNCRCRMHYNSQYAYLAHDYSPNHAGPWPDHRNAS